jgi:hypothetical protein
MECINLVAQHSLGAKEAIEINVTPGDNLLLTVRSSILNADYQDHSYFHAVMAIRSDLEALSYRLLCIGSMPNAIVSGMAQSMSQGRKAYLATLGEHTSHRDLFDIFYDADYDQTDTVQAQLEFKARWIESIGVRAG